jgi:hypothetical protein
MPGSVTYIRRSYNNFLYSSLPSLVHHKGMNKAPNTSKQYLLTRQTVFRRHCNSPVYIRQKRRDLEQIATEGFLGSS